MTLLQPQTLKLYYLIFDSFAISAILRPEVRKVLSPPHCQRKSCCCLHINPVCRFVLASQPQRFVFFHSQMKCGSGIELVSDGGRAMNPLLSSGSILKEPRSWFLKTPSFPADEGVFPWEKEWRMEGWLPAFGFFSCLAGGHEKNSGENPLFFLISACLSIRRGSRRGIPPPGP